MSLQHVKLAPGDVAPTVLLPGDPGRVPVVASVWDEARELASNREYVTYTGVYRASRSRAPRPGSVPPPRRSRSRSSRASGRRRSSGSDLRVAAGPCSRQDIAIFDSAIRADGASALYAPLEYPAVAHHEVVDAAIAAARGSRCRITLAPRSRPTCSTCPSRGRRSAGTSSPLGASAMPTSPDERDRGRDGDERVARARPDLGAAAGALALVSDAVDDTSESGSSSEATFDVSAEPIDRLARVGCETARILDERAMRPIFVLGWATVEEAPAQRNLVLILARAFAAQIATAVFLLDEEGTIIYNEAAERLTGRPFIEGAGMTAGEWMTASHPRTTPAT